MCSSTPSELMDAKLVVELYEQNLEQTGLSPEVKAYIKSPFKIGPKGKEAEHRVMEMHGVAIQTLDRVYVQYGSHKTREYMDTDRDVPHVICSLFIHFQLSRGLRLCFSNA